MKFWVTAAKCRTEFTRSVRVCVVSSSPFSPWKFPEEKTAYIVQGLYVVVREGFQGLENIRQGGERDERRGGLRARDNDIFTNWDMLGQRTFRSLYIGQIQSIQLLP